MKRALLMILPLAACTQTTVSEQTVALSCSAPSSMAFNIKGLKPDNETECFVGQLEIKPSDPIDVVFCANASSQAHDFIADLQTQPKVLDRLKSSIDENAEVSFTETLNYLSHQKFAAKFKVKCTD
ncbi:hypothetical protein [Vibrio sp. 16]|uniref:hypothetical protein n=1 Tax=Vibrio sp. 16 TaxID=391586 RepID=UPI0005C59490|nr:hypothetical protein [Vibrio sp. 16]CAK4075297.1 hypothetical protein VDT1_3914 [Vibrio sp. 16]